MKAEELLEIAKELTGEKLAVETGDYILSLLKDAALQLQAANTRMETIEGLLIGEQGKNTSLRKQLQAAQGQIKAITEDKANLRKALDDIWNKSHDIEQQNAQLRADLAQREAEGAVMRDALEYYANAETIYAMTGVNNLAKQALAKVKGCKNEWGDY